MIYDIRVLSAFGKLHRKNSQRKQLRVLNTDVAYAGGCEFL